MVLVTLVLWLLAAYHIVMGVVALFAPQSAPMVVRSLYGAAVTTNGQLRYMTSMIGALSLAIGGLAAVAAPRPYDNRAIIAALLALQLSRVFCRVRDRRVLAQSFGVSRRANVAAIAVLSAESVVLLLGLR
jgi:hypothetical protein